MTRTPQPLSRLPCAWSVLMVHALLTLTDFGLPNLIEERLNLSSLPAFLSAMIPAWPLQGHHRYDTTTWALLAP